MELNQAIELINSETFFKTEKEAWIDLGCGTGLFTEALASRLAPDSEIYAVDKSAEALKKLKSSKKIQIKKIQADFNL